MQSCMARDHELLRASHSLSGTCVGGLAGVSGSGRGVFEGSHLVVHRRRGGVSSSFGGMRSVEYVLIMSGLRILDKKVSMLSGSSSCAWSA